METDVPPTPDQARDALRDADEVRASVTRLSATPWPLWFSGALTFYCAALPVVYGGIVAPDDRLLPRATWVILGVVVVATFLSLFAVAARAWTRRTGVALRLDVLPRKVALPVAVGYPVLTVGAVALFRFTGNPLPIVLASAAGAALAIGSHLVFARLHRSAA